MIKMYDYEVLIKGSGARMQYLLPPEWFNYEGELQYVPRNRISNELLKINKDLQDYYDRWVLGILSKKDQPKCCICGKGASWIKFSAGYRSTCCSLECKSKLESKVQIEIRKDPNCIFNSEEYRISLSEGISKAWKDPDSGYNTEEYKMECGKRLSQASKASRDDPDSVFNSKEYHDYLSSLRTRLNIKMWNDPNSVFNSKEYREKKSLAMIKYFGDHPEASILISERLTKNWADPNSLYRTKEHSELRSKILKELWNKENSPYRTKELYNCRSEHMRNMWNHPELYPLFHEGLKRYWESGGAFGVMINNPQIYEFPYSFNKKFHSGYFNNYTKSLQIPRYLSNYELKLIELLESDPDVKLYEMQPKIRISYIDNEGYSHKYLPDCLIYSSAGNKILVEVKPIAFTTTDINLRKFKAAEEYCIINNLEWRIVTEFELWQNYENQRFLKYLLLQSMI